MAPAAALIDSILEGDRKAQRKQRHTARRIFDRIAAEVQAALRRSGRCGNTWSDAGVNWPRPSMRRSFRSYDWGVEAQVDWYEAYADLDGERVKLYVFSMRSMASGATFHQAYPTATQHVFLEAHKLAFAYLEGVLQSASLR